MNSSHFTARISTYFHKNFKNLAQKKFHFASRHYLWFRDQKSLRFLRNFEKKFIGKTRFETEKIIESLLKKNPSESVVLRNEPELRNPILQKYPLLIGYNKILFRFLFGTQLYGRDISPMIAKRIPLRSFVRYRNKLLKNAHDLVTLSTIAVNFLFLLKFYEKALGRNTSFNLGGHLFRLAQGQYSRKGPLSKKWNLQLYFYTHCIINASKFYSAPLPQKNILLKKMLLQCESLIASHYEEINLDNKLEFLVCCRLLRHRSHLFPAVFSEAEHSLSPDGDFLIDTLNTLALLNIKSDFVNSEHRNILFLMAFSAQAPSHFQEQLKKGHQFFRCER